jgi:DNA recombination protein RmuC
MMDLMTATLLLAAVLGAVVAAVAAWEAARRRFGADLGVDPDAVQDVVHTALDAALTDLAVRSGAERDAAVRAAVEHVAILNREQMGSAAGRVEADLSAKKDLIDTRLDEVRSEVRTELHRLSSLVADLGRCSAERFGQVDESLRSHAAVAGHLAETTQALREALTNPQARGQWGERMAEDVLRVAGFVEDVNYRKQTALEGSGGRPDYTFELPKGHVLHMDVKFPMAAYLRYLEAGTDAERQVQLRAFLRDVRARVRELARRDYTHDRPSLDYVLLFLPNEHLTGFIHEHDPGLLDDAMGQRVVMCSPLTLFAFLGVIRQAFDNFVVEQTSDEILQLIGMFGQQWQKYTESAEKVKKRLESVQNEFDQLVGVRRRALERPLAQLEDLRVRRNLPADGRILGDDLDNVTELPA